MCFPNKTKKTLFYHKREKRREGGGGGQESDETEDRNELFQLGLNCPNQREKLNLNSFVEIVMKFFFVIVTFLV